LFGVVPGSEARIKPALSGGVNPLIDK